MLADAINEPGPKSTRWVSKPLRRIRVAVSRFTSATEPSKGTRVQKTYAFSPGSAWMVLEDLVLVVDDSVACRDPLTDDVCHRLLLF